MNDNTDFDSLERMLAQPALIADQGFSESISEELARESRKTISLRTKVFMLAGCAWLVLVLATASPPALTEALAGMLTSLSFSEQLSLLGSSSGSIDYTILLASYPSLLAFLFSVAAFYNILSKN